MKTHHRITGTILAIALAATTAAPAATPPQIKLPPKAPVAVKAPAVPKVPTVQAPVAPKIVSAPKIPDTPKVPTIKAPAAPKLPAAPAAIKVPVAIKTPVAPKVPTITPPAAPKIPVVVKTPVAPKIPTVPTPAAPKVPSAPIIVKTPVAPKVPVAVKVVSAPVTPKTPVTPRLPVTPKVVTLPPTEKTPAAPVKVPDVSRVTTVREVKVPAVAIKRPTIIVPPAEAPKVHAMGGGKPKGTANATLIANSSKRAAIAEAVKTSATLTRGDTVSSIRSTVESARRDNPGNRLAETFLPDLPKTPKDRAPVSGTPRDTAKPGTSGRTVTKELFDTLTGKGGSAGKGLFSDALPKRETPALKDINSAPGFDQGFGSRPDVSGFDPGSLNPMNGIVNNTGIGGPLGEAANRFGNGVLSGGVAGMGKSLIKDDPSASPAPAPAPAPAKPGVLDKAKEAVTNFISSVVTSVLSGAGTVSDAAKVATPAGAVVGVAGGIMTANLDPEGQGKIDEANGIIANFRQGKKGTGNKNAAEQMDQVDLDQPDPENEGSVDVNIYDLSPGLAQQVGQSRLGKKGSQGGNGDVKPADDNGAGAGRVVGAEISPTLATDMKNNLVGNPGQRGVRESGGSTATPPARSNGAGTITPTDDQNTATSGGRQQDPGDFFGNGVRPDQSRLNGNNSSSSSSGSSTSGENPDDTKNP